MLVNSWLKQNCKFAKQTKVAFYDEGPSAGSAKEKTEDERTAGYIQWMTGDGELFFPASYNQKKLDPGFYEIQSSMSQGLYFEKISTTEEGLIKFPDTTSDKVVSEIENFWDKEELFRESKISYKRGIMLYGPPGSGKTCTIKVVVQNLVKRGGVVIKFNRPGLVESGMKILRKIQKTTPVIILMEDIDAILDRNNESDVINIIDGVTLIDKVVFLATTNYPERLGSRIMNRPSRFDKKFLIGMPNGESRKLYFQSIANGKITEEEMKKWVNDTEGLSISHLKELYVAVKILGDEYNNAISLLKGMKVKVNSNDFDSFGKADVSGEVHIGNESPPKE